MEKEGRMPNPQDEITRCELMVKNGQLFIRSIDGNNVFVNGQLLSPGGMDNTTEMHRLGDNDSFGLGMNHNQPSINSAKYLLKVKDLSMRIGMEHIPQNFSDSDENDQSIIAEHTDDSLSNSVDTSGNSTADSSFHINQSQDDGNENKLSHEIWEKPIILSHIFSFLPFTDLKNSRRVAQNWKLESQKYFLPQCTISLQPSPWIRDWEKEFRYYSDNVAGYGHENFKICYSGHPSDGFVEEDVLVFVRRHGHQFKILELTIMPGRNDFAFLRDILCDPSLNNLEELSVTLVCNDSDYTSRYFPSGIVLSSVKSLILNFGFEDEPSEQLVKFAPHFVNSFPNIVKFQINADDSTECILEKPVLQEFFNKLVAGFHDVPCEETTAFSNLREIRLQWATAEVMDLLIDFPHQLKLIDVHMDRYEVDTHRIQNLLDKHAPVLEELCLGIHCDSNGKTVPEGEPPVEIPRCPKLKKLSYIFYLNDDIPDYVESVPTLKVSDVDLLSFSQLFLVGSEHFQEKFPALFSLQIVLTRHVESFFHQLFPEQDSNGKFIQIPQITHFRTTFPSGSGHLRHPWTSRISSMFPNAHNHELHRTRIRTADEDAMLDVDMCAH